MAEMNHLCDSLSSMEAHHSERSRTRCHDPRREMENRETLSILGPYVRQPELENIRSISLLNCFEPKSDQR